MATCQQVPLRRAGKTLLALLALVFLSLASAQTSYADPVIYNNGAPNGANGNEMTQWIQAEDFTLGSNLLVTEVTFWGVNETGFPGAYTGSITWFIYSNAGTNPGAIIASGSVTVAGVFDHNATFGQSFRYDFSIGSVNLAPGTYWLGLHNGPLTTTNRRNMYWETTNNNATLRGREDQAPFGDNVWFNNGQEHAFILYGLQPGAAAIPEPTTMLLLGTGLAGVAARIRKRRKTRGQDQSSS